MVLSWVPFLGMHYVSTTCYCVTQVPIRMASEEASAPTVYGSELVTEHYIRDINDILRIGWLAGMQTTLAGLVVNLVIAVRLSS